MENASKALIIAGAILISILLISIGIMLINSGREVTETGTASMGSYKIQSFNSNFTFYEGDSKKGSEIKNLFSAVAASNQVDEHKVTVNGKEDMSACEPNASTIKLTADYSVKCEYKNGYVSNIVITLKSTTPTTTPSGS